MPTVEERFKALFDRLDLDPVAKAKEQAYLEATWDRRITHRVHPEVALRHIKHKLYMRQMALYIIGQAGRDPLRAQKALDFERKNRQ